MKVLIAICLVLISILLILALASCSELSKVSEENKNLIEAIKKNYKGDYRHISLDTADVIYISGKPFKNIEESSTINVYCNNCNSEKEKLTPNEFYFDLEDICIKFKGNCVKCNDTLISGYAIHQRVVYLKRILELRNKHL